MPISDATPHKLQPRVLDQDAKGGRGGERGGLSGSGGALAPHPGPFPSRKTDTQKIDQDPEDAWKRRTHREVESGEQRRGGTSDGRTPRGQQVPGCRPRAATGGEMYAVMTVGAGMQRGAQRRAAEAGGWWVCATSKWTAHCIWRGGGEFV